MYCLTELRNLREYCTGTACTMYVASGKHSLGSCVARSLGGSVKSDILRGWWWCLLMQSASSLLRTSSVVGMPLRAHTVAKAMPKLPPPMTLMRTGYGGGGLLLAWSAVDVVLVDNLFIDCCCCCCCCGYCCCCTVNALLQEVRKKSCTTTIMARMDQHDDDRSEDLLLLFILLTVVFFFSLYALSVASSNDNHTKYPIWCRVQSLLHIFSHCRHHRIVARASFCGRRQSSFSHFLRFKKQKIRKNETVSFHVTCHFFFFGCTSGCGVDRESPDLLMQWAGGSTSLLCYV